jgi:general secretion pathway protein K
MLLGEVPAPAPQAGARRIALGDGAWCDLRADVPAARIDVNRASRRTLRLMLGSDSLADALLDWRDADQEPRRDGAEAPYYVAQRLPVPRNAAVADIEELRSIRGFASVHPDTLAAMFTTRSDGIIDVNAMPPAFIASLDADSAGVLEALATRRRRGERIGSLAALLPPEASDRLGGMTLVTEAERYEVTVTGGFAGSGVRAVARLTFVRLPSRLALVRRELP